MNFLIFLLPILASAAPQIEFAVTDGTVQRLNRILVQGERASGAKALANACAENVCRCEVYFEEGMLEYPIQQVSKENNTVSCRTLQGMNPESVSHVRVKGADFVSEKIRVKKQLELRDVLGDKNLSLVRKVFRYSCERTFFEGEGVSPAAITCVLGGQRLGLITAKYDFYLYLSNLDNNFQERSGDSSFENSICGYAASLKTSCASPSQQAEYGLFREQMDPFVVSVHLSSNPDGGFGLFGFAALPDASGDCPVGLVKAAPFTAYPQSMPIGRGLPSDFINKNNLNNTRLSITQEGLSSSFQVFSQANKTPCEFSTGDCTNVTFASARVAQDVPYMRQSPTVCVIPRSLLVGYPGAVR
jgi:hypothetical protein